MERIALVTQDLTFGGGVATLTAFLYDALSRSGRYHPEIISLASRSDDSASVRLRSPSTWMRGIQIETRHWEGRPYRHVGAFGAELEFLRCKPRVSLTSLLQEFDLVQFLLGSPSLAQVAVPVTRPVLLWTATTTWADRASRLAELTGLRRLYWVAMTQLVERCERRALQKAAVVFALSRYTQDALARRVPADRLVLAPCGVDTDRYRPASPGTRPVGSRYIVSAGRFSDRRKNVGLLIRAYSRLCGVMPDAPDLYLVGSPPNDEILSGLVRGGIRHRVKLLGRVSEDVLISTYQGAECFVLSSDEEGLGIVILEAMATGIPAVATDCGGPATIIQDGVSGYLTPVGDEAALSDRLQRLLADSAVRREMGIRSRRLVVERFSLQAASQPFLDAYDRLLRGADS